MSADGRIETWLRSGRCWGGAAVVLVGSLLVVSPGHGGGPGVWMAVTLAGGLAVALASTEDAAVRRPMLVLALVAASARAAAHAALVAWTSNAGGPFLGPDSASYFFRSVLLADAGFHINDTPALHFGTYDAAHYYLYAALVRLCGADLLALQAANWSMTALAAPVTWSIARRLAPTHAWAIGLVVALYPSLIAISVNDLLKDSSVVLASLVVCWVLIRLAFGVRRGPGLAGFVMVGALALIYLRMSRFYVAAFLLGAAAVVLAIAWWRARAGGPRLEPAALLALVLVFGLGEVTPRLLGWPYSPVMFADQLLHVLDSPLLRQYTPGLITRLATGRADSSGVGLDGSLPGTGPALPDAGEGHSLSELLARVRPGKDGPPQVAARPRPPATARTVERPVAEGSRVLVWATNGIRKLFGPYPWVPPPDLSPETITQGDYLLFPGMLVWYAILPIALLALAMAMGDGVRGTAGAAPFGLALFTAALFLLYMAINLSWRQREFMFPFLVLLAFSAIDRFRTLPWLPRAYTAYWLALVLMAALHTAVRHWLG